MSFLTRTTGVLLDEAILGIRRLFHPPALAEDAGLALPVFDALAGEHIARPPEAILPARFDRDPARPTRITLHFPALETSSFADFYAAPPPPRDAARLTDRSAAAGSLGSAAPASDSARLRASHGAPDTLVLYHHGLSEVPHDVTGRPILTRAAALSREGREGISSSRAGADGRFDWAIVKAPLHDDRSTVATRFLASLNTFGRCLLGSVYATRALARALKARFGYRHVVFAGMSMGGVVALLDASLPGSPFGLHIPLLAGPDVGDVLLRSSFSKIVCRRAHRAASASPDLERLDLASRLGALGTPIRAVLTTHDRLFRIEAQRAAYARVPRARLVEIDAGHVTGAFRFTALASIVRATLEREIWAESLDLALDLAAPTPHPARLLAPEIGLPHGIAAAVA